MASKKQKPSFVKKIFTKKRVIILSIVAALVFGFFKYQSAKSGGRIETSKIEKGTVREELVLSGVIKAENHARLAFQGSGKIAFIGVREGDVVKKGSVLARLDTNSLYQQVEQSETDIRYYQSVVDRVLDEVKGHDDDETFAQREERTQAEAARDKVYRAREVARQNLANASLRAPFDGVITNVTLSYTGINIPLGEYPIEMVDIKTAFFEVTADQSEVTKLSVGQKVAISLDSFSEKEFDGKVVFVGSTPKPGETSSVYVIKVLVNFSEDDLSRVKVGMTGDGKFILSQKSDVLYLSPSFLKSDINGRYVNLEKKNNKKYVEVGIESEERVEIKGEISEGQTVYD